MKWVISPSLFGVPSTLNTLITEPSQVRGSCRRQAKRWLINVSPAPQSIRAFVSTVLLFPDCTLERDTGICIDLFSISATSTEFSERIGEIDVEAILPFKNPWFLLWNIRRCRLEGSSEFRRVLLVLSFLLLQDLR